MKPVEVRRIHAPLRTLYRGRSRGRPLHLPCAASAPDGDPLHATVSSISYPGLRFDLSVNERIGGSGIVGP